MLKQTFNFFKTAGNNHSILSFLILLLLIPFEGLTNNKFSFNFYSIFIISIMNMS